MSFIKWGNTCRQLGIDWTVETMTNESLISRARNTLTAKFLNTEGSTHLMFIDADIGWEPWHLLALLNADKDVIGGLYPMKSLPVKWCVNGIPGADENDPSGLVEVTKTGTGFLLMKRHVFEKLNSHPAVKPFTNDIGLDPALNVHMKTYFDTAVREGRYYSEDWTFCENWRDLGNQIFVDKRVLLKHTGTYVFDFGTHEKLYHDLAEMYNTGGLPKTMPQSLPAAEHTVSTAPAAAPTPHQLAAEPAPAAEAKVMASSKGKNKKQAKAA
jgi:hypothetical protein